MIYACEHHDGVLELWREQDLRRLRLVHVDFHDDLRGLYVHRGQRRAYPIGRLAQGNSSVDAGNFLAHAVLEGRVERVRWVHDEVGGRAWDMGIVRYDSDLFAWPHRLRQWWRPAPVLDFAFEELALDAWSGALPGEKLSVDWDCFASILQDAEGIETRVRTFLDRLGDPAPPDSYVCYSPDYSRPTLDRFLHFVDELARVTGQDVVWLSPGLPRGETHPSGVAGQLPRGPVSRLVLALRRRGIY